MSLLIVLVQIVLLGSIAAGAALLLYAVGASPAFIVFIAVASLIVGAAMRTRRSD